MTIRYYTEDISVVPFRLLVHAISQTAPKPLAWLLAGAIRIAGKFGLRLPPTHGVGFVDTETIVDPAELPAPATARWAPLVEQLRDLGFRPLKCEIAATIGSKEQCATTLLDESGTTIAILEWTRMPVADGVQENTPLEFDSYCENGPDVVTGVVRKADVPMSQMFQLESVEMVSLADDRPLAERYQEHRQRCAGKQILELTTENALQVVRQRAQQRFEALLEAGILRELSPNEIAKLRRDQRPNEKKDRSANGSLPSP